MERLRSGRGDAVQAPAAAVDGLPLALQEPELLQAVQGRVYRTLGQLQRAVGPLTDRRDDQVTVPGALTQDIEKEEVEMPFDPM